MIAILNLSPLCARQMRNTGSMMGEGDEDSEYDSEYNSDESGLADGWDSNDELSSDEGERRRQVFYFVRRQISHYAAASCCNEVYT